MKNHSLALFFYFIFLASSASAFNITRILNQFPDYSVFNELLTKSNLANEISSRSTITVLAFPNGAAGDLSGKPVEVLRRILATHVVLDYYDIMKLQKMKEKTAKLTTMFQQSGKAAYDQGFLNVTARDGGFFFGSAVKGAQRDAKLEQSVMNQPYNISILGLSHPIVTPGLDGTLQPVTAPPPKTTAAPPPSKTSSPPAESPEEVVVEAEAPASKAPTPSKEADTPVSSPPVSADAPADDEADDKAPASSKSSAEKMNVSIGLFVVLASMVAAY